MRRIVLVLAGMAALFVSTSAVASAHGGCNPHPHHGHARNVYRPPVVYRPYVAGYNPYAVPYYNNAYAYPSAGFGLSGQNFSVWFQR